MASVTIDTERPAPGRIELMLGFLKIGLMGFGGVGPIARHVIVSERGWLDEADYARTIGVCQVLPGANTVNAAVMIGDRFGGVTGALAALIGLMGAPLAIATALAFAYGTWGDLPMVKSTLHAVAATAAGLVLGTGARLAWASPRRLSALVGIGGAVVAVAVFRQSLAVVVMVLAPIAIAIGAWEMKRAR